MSRRAKKELKRKRRLRNKKPKDRKRDVQKDWREQIDLWTQSQPGWIRALPFKAREWMFQNETIGPPGGVGWLNDHYNPDPLGRLERHPNAPRRTNDE